METDARLDLIDLAASLVLDPDVEDGMPLVGLIRDLCRGRNSSIAPLLTSERIRAIRNEAPEEYDAMAEAHGWPKGY